MARAAGTIRTLYRAVLPAELASIQTTGRFLNTAGIETKYFSVSLRGARVYASLAARAFGDGPFTIVRTTVQADLIMPDMEVTVDGGIDTVAIPARLLDSLGAPVIVSGQ